MAVNPIPDGYSRVSPYLLTENADAVVKFILDTFDAQDRGTMRGPEGAVMHAEVKIGDTVIMVSDSMPGYPPMRTMVHVYVKDSDATVKKAVANGGVEVGAVETRFYGDRAGEVKDPGGNSWWISTRVEDVSEEEMERRMKEAKG